MTEVPRRLLLDTNVFIIGYLDLDSPEAKLLEGIASLDIILIFSNDLEEQIRRVGRRLLNKDWVGQILFRIWHDYQIEYIQITPVELDHLDKVADIPREDVGIYLTAIRGQAQCFISANRQLLKDASAKQNLFECLRAEDFLVKYLTPS